MWLEIAWSAIPLAIALVMFVWGTRVFFDLYRPPANAVEYTAIGRQWMWKIQHPEGQREINTLHVPVGQAVKMKLASEDVIHSFYIPAFRIKQDAVPGRYTSIWFQATKPGVYHLFCAEYCGAEHSKMIGSIIVMEPRDYESWLAGGTAGKSMVASGADLFQSLACVTCHRAGDTGRLARGPALEGVYGSQVKLADGRTVTADDDYLRESDPQSHGEGRGGLRAGDAHLPGAGERGTAQPAHRLRPLPRQRQGRHDDDGCGCDCGSRGGRAGRRRQLARHQAVTRMRSES